MKLFLCSTLLVATQANFFRHVLKSHRVPHFLGAGKNHATNKFHAVFQIVHDTDLASTEVEYFDCGTNDASTCLSGSPIHTVADLSNATVSNDAAVTNVKDTNNNVYDLEYTPSQGYNHIITKLELNTHTILEESYLCAAGHVPKSSGAGCDKCTPGKYAERGARTCSDCAAGKDSAAGATKAGDCAKCASGKYSTGGGLCQDCGTGKYYDATTSGATASSQCSDCAIGKYNDLNAAASCKDCDPDSPSGGNGAGYQNATGQASCKTCTALGNGQFVTSADVCTATTDTNPSTCSIFTNCANGIQNCVFGNIFTGNGADAYCTGGAAAYNCVCNHGTGTGSTASCTTCDYCNTGYELSASSCITCNAGEFGTGGITSCQQCTAGKYSQAGATQCTDCDDGQEDTGTDGNKATACRDCPIGKYDDDLIASTACKVCGRGKYQNAVKKTSCTDCAAGSHNDGAGGSNTDTAGDMDDPTDCVSCGAGTFSAAGAATCTDCAVGTYSTATGATASSTCLDCNANNLFGVTTGLTTATAGSGQQSDCVFAVTMYGYVHANLTGMCQDECVEWHGELKDNFANAHDVHRLNATGADYALCNLLKKTGEMIKQQGC